MEPPRLVESPDSIAGGSTSVNINDISHTDLFNSANEISHSDLSKSGDELVGLTCLIDSSDTSDTSESELETELVSNNAGNKELRNKLRKWALKNACTRQCVNGLLEILIEEGFELPKDSRTLLNIKVFIPSSTKCGGDYIYWDKERHRK